MVLSCLEYGSVTLNSIAKRLMDRLQSVLNATARLVCNSRKYNRISPLLRDQHWLRVPERTKFRLQSCSAAASRQHLNTWQGSYSGLSRSNRGQRRLRGWSYAERERLRTVGDRAFSSAAPPLWNSLPVDIVASQSLATSKGA